MARWLPHFVVAIALAIVGWSVVTGHVWPLYGLLVGVTLWTCWRDEITQAVGWALLVSWVGSNLAHWFLPVLDQPQAYTVAETAVLSMAFFSHVLGASRAMVALVAVSMVSIGANFYVSSFDTLTKPQIVAWEVFSNACFVVENLLVIVPMIYDRVCRSHPGAARRWLRVALHGRAAGTAGAER